MLPIAVTTSPRTFVGGILAVLACWLVPHTTIAAGACVLVLLTGAVVATAFAMAHLATQGLAVHDERFCVIDTFEGVVVRARKTTHDG